ncbi:MAG: glycosyltransferase family 4 protein [Myxococcales bacterium]|nr:glycosyltransferase family 4 protein [Myxococcales bacterium]
MRLRETDARGRRIVIDGSMAKGGGGFTYLVNIVPELSRQAPRHRFKVLCADARVAAALAPCANVEVEYLGALGLLDRLRFTYRRAGRLAREWGADVYFSAGEMAPLDAGCPTMAAFRNPNVFTLGEGQGLTWVQRARVFALNALARLSARCADRILFVSRDSASWIGDAIGLEPARRKVIHHGIDVAPWRDAREEREPHERGYILSVSSVYPYKNYVRLIEAWVELAKRRPDVPDLVIVGDEPDAAAAAAMREARDAAGELAEGIHLLGEVPYAEIRRYYRGADLFVFPSYLETFGHPLLEAMAADVPLVAADIPVFREIAGDAAFYADPFSPSELAKAIEEALFARGAAEALVKRGRERVTQFTWRRSAAALLAVLDELAAGDRDGTAAPVAEAVPFAAPAPELAPLRIAARIATAGA